MAKSKTEQVFTTEVKHSVEYYYKNAFWLKIPDLPVFKGSKTRFAPQKPFDFMLAYKGNLIAVEAKVHKKHTAWPLSSVKDHQIEGLLSIGDNGFKSYVMLNVRFGIGKSKYNKSFLFSPQTIKQLKEMHKSIPVKELQLLSNVVNSKRVDKKPKGRISIWDIESCLNLSSQ